MTLRIWSLLMALLGSVVAVTAAHAQAYPNKPIRVIVPLVAGSSADAVARVVLPVAARHLGQPIVIENEGGAASIAGTTRGSKAAPDGYTLTYGNTSTHAVNPYIFNTLPYDPDKDFIPVANTAAQGLIMAVPASSPAKSVKELVELAKQGKATKYASLGPGTSAHLSAERLKVLTGIALKHIPFPPGPQGVLAMGRGEIDTMFYSYASFLPAVQAGSIRLIGIAMPERSKFLPELPTLREQGYDVVIQAWYGLFAPAGTPKEIVDKLADAVNKAVADPEVIKTLNAAGTDAYPSKSAEDFARFVKAEREKYRTIIEQAGVPKT
jgi:tripartite-type tricarboxylate transporter receptor subunit TctC